MESLLSDLRVLLGEQMENLRSLESAIRQQQVSLTSRDVSGIIESISEQEECLERIQRIERERDRLVTHISSVLGLGSRGVTLRELTEKLDPDVGAQLRSTGEAVRETLMNIGRVNRDNRRLIEHSLEFVQETLSTLSGKGPEKRTYESSGSLRPRSQRQMLLDRTT